MITLRKIALLCTVALAALTLAPAAGQETGAMPRVALLGFENATGNERFEAAAGTATDSLFLTLQGIHRYQLVSPPDTPEARAATRSEKTLAAWCDQEQCDYMIYGQLRAGQDETLDCVLSVFGRVAGRTIIASEKNGISLLGIFEATDGLITSVLETVTGSHIGYGTLLFTVSGAGEYEVDLDGLPAGKNIRILPRVVAGTHRVLARQVNGESKRTLYEHDITIEENGESQIALSIPNEQSTLSLGIPNEIPGEIVYIPYPITITIDGDVSDWRGIPVQKVTTGPKKSPVSTQTPSFDFSVAADAHTLYFRMSVVDSRIIAKRHGKDFWNEDSLEFYVNLSGHLDAKKYTAGIAQFNINAGDIGKMPGNTLTISGIGSDAIQFTGAVFKTADGWGFEAAIPLGSVNPEEGLAIGIQAQVNGATVQDRDCKLIWSKADKGDQSFANPSLFGKGVFYHIGSTNNQPGN